MQQQPLAFTLVKTVVSARDNGKVLSPALATAWDLLRTELSPAHRVIASEVKWSPAHQEDLRFVIEGIRKQFDKDPELEGEFLAFLAEVEPFGEGDDDTSILPIVIGFSSGSSIASPIEEVAFSFEGEELHLEQNPASGSQNVQSQLPESEVAVDEVIIDGSTPTGEAELAQAFEPVEATDPSLVFDEDVSSTSREINLPKDDEIVQEEGLDDEPIVEQPVDEPVRESPRSSLSVTQLWPVAAGAMLLSLLAFGIWTYSGSAKEQKLVEVTAHTDMPADTTAISAPEASQVEEPIPYSEPIIARLSEAVDSLRLAGEYAAALTQQQGLVKQLEDQGSLAEETAQAYSELAILYSTQEKTLQAIIEQRKSLVFARQAFAKTDPALGRSHLKLASFYTAYGELHMARAHLQQARQIFGQTQELVSPSDLEKSDRLEAQLLEAS